MTVVESAWPRFPDYRIALVPCQGLAEVRGGGTLLAQSNTALRLIETDHVERLCFPEGDVRLELLRGNDHRSVCPFKGEASYWSYTGVDGDVEDIFWTYRVPFAEVTGIDGCIAVYHEKAGVEVRVGTA